MRLHHIDDAQAAAISGQLDRHASDIDGVVVANSHLWDDEAARRAFDAAMIKDTRVGVVTPSIAYKPLVMHTPHYRALLQFQSYTFAAHSRSRLRRLLPL